MDINQIQNFIANKTTLDKFDNQNKLSSVLVIINSYKPKIIMIKRSHNLGMHKGEMAFPGGKYDPYDKNILDTAIRETKEELNLTIFKDQIIAKLTPVSTSTGFIIFPFVSIINNIKQLQANKSEVETVFNIPLFSFLDTIEFQNQSNNSYIFTYQNNIIWGASARILKQLRDILYLISIV